MEFSLSRISGLLKKDFRDIFIPMMKVLAVIFLVLTIINVFNQWSNSSNDPYQMFYNWGGFLLISSAIFGSLSFGEVSKRFSRIEYLTLPASTLEKTVAKAALVMVVFPISMLVLYLVYFGLFKLLCSMFGFPSDAIFSHEDPTIGFFIFLGTLISSLFAYGSIKYNNGSFVKIILRIIALIACFALFMFLTGLVVFPEFRAEIGHEVFGMARTSTNMITTNNFNPENHWVFKFAIFTYKYLLIPLFWILIYFTIKEKEA